MCIDSQPYLYQQMEDLGIQVPFALLLSGGLWNFLFNYYLEQHKQGTTAMAQCSGLGELK